MIPLLESRRTTSLIGGLLLAALLVATGCQSGGSSSAVSATLFSAPASAGSGQPRLHAEDGGPVWLSWVEPVEDEGHALRYATLKDTSWTEPRTAARGENWFVNWADVPSLRPLPDGRLAGHFLQSNGRSPLAYAVRITQTTAGGAWQPPVTPHDDGTETEHGFVSLVPWFQHRLLAVWLDGRKMDGEEGHQGEMTLRGAVLDSAGTVEGRALLDARTCECCPTSMVRAGDEALVAYRDRAENELRNIRLVRFDGQSWSEPALLHDDGWKVSGCPVNGPALAAEGDRVAAAWFTAAGGTPRVRVAFSTDGGRTFSDPTVAAKGKVEGRVDLVLLDDGTVVVSWLSRSEESARLQARRIGPDGEKNPAFTIASLPAASRGVGMPRLVRQGSHLYAAWTNPEAEESSAVRLARMPTEALR